MSRASAARRVPVLVAFFPQRFELTPRVWGATLFEYGLDPGAFDLQSPHRRLGTGCADRGLSCADLLAGFQASGDSSLYQPQGDMHWSDAGHDLAAALLAREIEEAFPSLAPARP